MSIMEPSPPSHRPQSRPSQQLPLPLEPPPSHTRPARPTITITPRQVWATLTLGLQAQFRQSLVHVIQESLRDG
jgi:hypothetical protein